VVFKSSSQVAPKPAQDAGFHQECATIFGKLGQHVAGEVGPHQFRPAGKVEHRLVPLGDGAADRRQMIQLQTRSPSAGTPGQGRCRFGSKRLVVYRGEQFFDFLGPESEIVAAKFLVSSPKPVFGGCLRQACGVSRI
jgi:hypothetical protein